MKASLILIATLVIFATVASAADVPASEKVLPEKHKASDINNVSREKYYRKKKCKKYVCEDKEECTEVDCNCKKLSTICDHTKYYYCDYEHNYFYKYYSTDKDCFKSCPDYYVKYIEIPTFCEKEVCEKCKECKKVPKCYYVEDYCRNRY